MTIATDYEAYKMATKQLTVTTTSTLITGTAGLAAENIPSEAMHMAVIPQGGDIYWAFGTASASTALIPSSGIVFNAPSAPALRGIQLYTPTTGATCQVIFGGQGGRVVLGDGENSETYDVGEPFTLLVDGSALGSALTDPAPAASKAEVIGTGAHGVLNCRGKSVARIVFGGTTTDGDIFNYQVILWSQAVGSSVTAAAWIPRVIANGAVTLGTDVYGASGAGMGAAAALFADTITDTVLDGAAIYNNTNLRAVLEVPLLDAERIEIQTDKTTGDTCDAFCQLGDSAGAGGLATGSAMFYEDEPHVSGDPGRMFFAVRTDTRASLAATTGDYAPLQLTSVGEARVRDDDANTDLAALEILLAVGTGVMTSAQAVTVATDDTVVGPTNASAVDGDTAGSLSAKLRGINKVLALMDADTSILAAGGGGGLTFTRVPFITAGAATTELLAKTGSQTQRLHKLVFTCSAAALIEVEDKDGGVLATWNVGANGGIVDPFTPHASGCIQQSVVNKGLQIVNSAGNLGGYAVVSTGA